MSDIKKKEAIKIVRILGTDIPSSKKLLYGFSKIKGISYIFSNALCNCLKLDKNRTIESLSDDEILKVEDFLQNPQKKELPIWLLNKQKDSENGENLHLAGKDIDFDLIKQRRHLFKIRTYKGLRARLKLPLRGQRTKSNFRRNKTLASIKSKSIKKENKK